MHTFEFVEKWNSTCARLLYVIRHVSIRFAISKKHLRDYRDHLASHLGDQFSMSPIVESCTLVPPAWMIHGSTKMGSKNVPVRGLLNALPPSVSLQEEVGLFAVLVGFEVLLYKVACCGGSRYHSQRRFDGCFVMWWFTRNSFLLPSNAEYSNLSSSLLQV